jgi:phage terminase large subunit
VASRSAPLSIGTDVFLSDAALVYLREKRKRERARARMSAQMTPTFRGANLEAQTITDHEWILAGPADTGKTWATIWRLDALLRETPRARAAIVRRTRAHMVSTVLHTYKTIQGLKERPSSPSGGEHPEWFDYANGARAFVIGLDKVGKVLSGEFDWIYVNQAEELSSEDWQILSSRCSGRGAVTRTPMLFGDCNPGAPSHWILSRTSLRMLHSRHEDNPSLHDGRDWTDSGLMRLEVLDSLTGVRKERLRHGRWVAAEGVVYEEFERGKHLIEAFEIPSDWRRFRSIDFGFTNPFTCQWWAMDPDGRLYLYRELYRTQRLVSDHAADILRLSEGEYIEATVADHDAEGRATLESVGILTEKADKSVLSGIERVQARMRTADDGFPRLLIMEGALAERDEALSQSHRPLCLLDELEVYTWQLSADGRPVKEEPLKVHDHGCDAMRYMVAHVDGESGGAGWAAYGEELKREREG